MPSTCAITPGLIADSDLACDRAITPYSSSFTRGAGETAIDDDGLAVMNDPAGEAEIRAGDLVRSPMR